MYTLSKAKEEIDTVANYALSIAEHALAIDEGLSAKFDSFKQDVFAHIDAKFAELQRVIMGEQAPSESSAVGDLGAKVALLRQAKVPQEQQGGHPEQHQHDQHWGGDHQHHG